MLKTTLYIFLMTMLMATPKQSHAQYFGGNKNDKGVSFCQKDGDFYLTATTRSFGAGSEDVWFIKVSDSFKYEFHQEWGGVHHDIPAKIIVNKEGDFVIAGHSWDAPGTRTGLFVRKVDANGSNIWTSYSGGSINIYTYDVKQSLDGGYLITGINRGEGPFGAIYLIKLNEAGVKQWEQFYDEQEKDIGMGIAEGEDSTIYLLGTTSSYVGKIANSSEYKDSTAGILLIKTDQAGNELWRKSYGGVHHDFARRIVRWKEHLYVVGSSMNNTNGSFDMALYKLDTSGTEIWRKNYGGADFEYGNDLDIDPDGNLLLTGASGSFSTDGGSDVYLVHTDSSGTVIWENTYGGDFSDEGACGQFLEDGNIALLGTSNSYTETSSDLYFVKLSAAGDIINSINNIEEEPVPSTDGCMIFPNPVSTYIKINSFETKVLSEPVEFSLFTISGALVLEERFDQMTNTIYFDQPLSPGVYLYKIKTSGQACAGKIIIN